MAVQDEMKRQLGMNPSTASNALKKEIMFSMAKELGRDTCFQCGETILDVKSFSVEHKTPWLHTDNPKETFFDLNNIAFSHMSCNARAGRKPTKKYYTDTERNKAKRESEKRTRVYDPEKRKAQYTRTGK